MAETTGNAGVVQAVVHITRKETGEVETYVLEGKVTHDDEEESE